MSRHLSVTFVCLLLGGCAGLRPGNRPPTEAMVAVSADTTAFALRVAAHEALPDSARRAIRAAAEDAAAPWREFESEVRQDFDSTFRHWFYRDNPVPMDHRGWGLPNAIVDLHKATETDPSFAEAWGALGHLAAETGDLTAAVRNLDNARVAARAEAAAGRPLAPDRQLQILRDRAWTLRDLARWDEGLEATAEGLAFRPGDPELLLVKGLLLADAGRYAEATALAAAMPALTYPRYDFTYWGFKRQTSVFANNWIRAQALLAVGQVDDAYHKLGDLDVYAYRGLLPCAPRYWRDAGLIAELAGDPKAPLYYAVGFVTWPYQHFYPVTPVNLAPLVLDVPSPRMPAYLGFGLRTWVAGSPFVYVGIQLNRMAMATDEAEQLRAGGRALQILGVLEKRGVRPAVCRALRGRVYYVGGDFGLARTELEAAHETFAAEDQVDAGTSLLLGLIAMRDERWPDAETVLAEAVDADAGSALGWRSLGVALSKNGRLDEADRAMSRSVALDAAAVAAWYNRGLLRLQRQRFGQAVADLDRALRLDPENREVQRLLQMASAGNRPNGGDMVAVTMGPPSGYIADPDSLAAAMVADLAQDLVPPDSLRSGSPEADRRFRALEAAYLIDPTPARRLVLAKADLDRNLLDSLQALLAPGWGKDLTESEQLMLLWADRNLGELARAEEAARLLATSGPGQGNPWVLAMAAETMRTSTDPLAAGENPFGNHFNYWFWQKSAGSGRSVNPFTKIAGYAFPLWLKYKDDPAFDSAVWGMSPTPLSGGSPYLGGAGPAK